MTVAFFFYNHYIYILMYCVSPLVQGGLEITCRVEIHMPSTVKNRELIEIYEKYVDTLYYQREDLFQGFIESHINFFHFE